MWKIIPVFLILAFSGLKYAAGQSRSGTSCTTPSQAPGTCIGINSCPVLLNLLMSQNQNNTVRSYLRASVCEYEGQNPIVCCPALATKSAQDGTTVTKLPKTPDCGFSNRTIPKIVNGVPAKLGTKFFHLASTGQGEFPWLVALGYRNSKNPQQPKWLCGGSLITDKHVLTAAHCVYNRQDLYIARLGDLDLFSDEDGASPSSILISKVQMHESYKFTKFSHDIAIVTLQQSVDNPTIWPICLPVSEPFRSMTYLNFNPTLAGWGSVSFKGPSSSALQQIFVPVLDNQECVNKFARAATIDEKVLCAGSLNGDKDACGGDSGGPLMHEISEGTNYRVYQIGIVSYGFQCAVPGYPGVYTRVTYFIDWIQKNLN